MPFTGPNGFDWIPFVMSGIGCLLDTDVMFAMTRNKNGKTSILKQGTEISTCNKNSSPLSLAERNGFTWWLHR